MNPPVICDTFQLPEKFWDVERGLRERQIWWLIELWEDKDTAEPTCFRAELKALFSVVAGYHLNKKLKKFYILVIYTLLQGRVGIEFLQTNDEFRECIVDKYEEFIRSEDQVFTDALKARKF